MEVKALEMANAVVDVLGVALGVLGAVYTIPILRQPSVRLTQGLSLGIVGALIGSPLTALFMGGLVGIGLITGAYRSVGEAGADVAAATVAPLAFGMMAGLIVGGHGIRSRPAARRHNSLLVGFAVILMAASAAAHLVGAIGLSIRLLVVLFLYCFAVGAWVEVPILDMRLQLKLGAVLVTVYLLLLVVVDLLLSIGPRGRLPAAVVEISAVLVALGALFGLYGFAFCNPVPEPTASRPLLNS
jgi:hypothetical protein